ncbi:hypothetical protein D3C75_625870 [compost metagenome]
MPIRIGLPLSWIVRRSAEADALVMKHTSYEFGALKLVSELRFKHSIGYEALCQTEKRG